MKALQAISEGFAELDPKKKRDAALQIWLGCYDGECPYQVHHPAEGEESTTDKWCKPLFGIGESCFQLQLKEFGSCWLAYIHTEAKKAASGREVTYDDETKILMQEIVGYYGCEPCTEMPYEDPLYVANCAERCFLDENGVGTGECSGSTLVCWEEYIEASAKIQIRDAIAQSDKGSDN
jgi:hypothetical protein